ncbi:MAG TPA: ComEC/Rec2 family competence protein, partial [Geobacteraceae bacterium]|nr:ComEC/Rec2 family competence protein [Geobacteraceae bacterium]
MLTIIVAVSFRSSLPFAIAIALLLFVAGNLVLQSSLKGNPGERQLLEQNTGRLLIVEGRVVGRPENRDGGSKLVVRPQHVVADGVMLPLCGDILLRAEQGGGGLLSGDLIRFAGKLRAPRNFGIPGEFDAERYYSLKGVGATCFIKNSGDILLIRRGELSLQRFFDAMALRAGSFIMSAVPGAEGGILKALLIGDCGDIPQELKDAYSRTGVNHILSISGFHVGIIALALFHLWFAVSRVFPSLLLYWNIRRFASTLSLPLVFVYLFLSGAAPATSRSVLMLAFFMVGMVLEREFDHFNALVLAALVLLLLNPANLYDISFQLSFLALWGIMVLTPLFVSFCPCQEGGKAYRFIQFFAASLAAVAVTLLPVAYYFQQSTLTGLLSNFFIVPLLGYGAVVAGFIALPLIWIFPQGAELLLHGSALLVKISNRIIGQLDRLPLLPDFAPSELCIAIFLSGLLLLTLLPRKEQKLRVLATVPLLLLTLQLLPASRRESGVRLDFFSVGQGESSLLTFANGQRMLVDGGGALHDGGWDPGRRLLLPCLRRMGVKRIDYLVLSHPHP